MPSSFPLPPSRSRPFYPAAQNCKTVIRVTVAWFRVCVSLSLFPTSIVEPLPPFLDTLFCFYKPSNVERQFRLVLLRLRPPISRWQAIEPTSLASRQPPHHLTSSSIHSQAITNHVGRFIPCSPPPPLSCCASPSSSLGHYDRWKTCWGPHAIPESSPPPSLPPIPRPTPANASPRPWFAAARQPKM